MKDQKAPAPTRCLSAAVEQDDEEEGRDEGPSEEGDIQDMVPRVDIRLVCDYISLETCY